MSYRTSHTRTGYAAEYAQRLSAGYYGHLWQQVEQPLIRTTLQRIRRAGADSVLDFACGTGRICGVNETVFGSCYGIDVSAEMLRVARANCPNTTFLCADITTDSMPDLPRVDVVTAFRFFLNAEDALRHQVLARFTDILNPGGFLVMNIQWNTASLSGGLYGLRNRALGRRHTTTTAATMRALLDAHGFDTVEQRGYGAYPWLGRGLDFSTAASVRTAERLARRIPRLQDHLQHVLLVAKRRHPAMTRRQP